MILGVDMTHSPGELVMVTHVVSLWENHDMFFNSDINNWVYGDWITELERGTVIMIISSLISSEADVIFGRWYYVIAITGECGWIFAPFNHDPFNFV